MTTTPNASSPPIQPSDWEVPEGINPKHAHAYWIGYLKGISAGWLGCMEEYDIEGDPEDG